MQSWFTRLPPVMLFELSRFQFNQQLGRPEKIHNKLEFPQIMYMDRYVYEFPSPLFSTHFYKYIILKEAILMLA